MRRSEMVKRIQDVVNKDIPYDINYQMETNSASYLLQLIEDLWLTGWEGAYWIPEDDTNIGEKV